MGQDAELKEGIRLWGSLSDEQKADITRIAGSDLVEATAEDDPPPFALDPQRVRQYALFLLGAISLNAQAAEEEEERNR